jgi:uncharacterized protein
MRSQRTSGALLSIVFLALFAATVLQGQARDSLLVLAAEEGDLQAVRHLVGQGGDVNETARDGSTALLWATYHGDVEMVRLLIGAGADVEPAERVRHLAAAAGQPHGRRAGRACAPRGRRHDGVGSSRRRNGADGGGPVGPARRRAAAARAGADVERDRHVPGADGADVGGGRRARRRWRRCWRQARIPDHRARQSTIARNGRTPTIATGGFTALHFAARNGHEAAVRALIAGGADPRLTNGDGATPAVTAIVNDRLDLAKTLVDLGADPDDGSLYFAVDMHDATTDMRARDGSRLRPAHPNALTALDLVRLLLERGADPNKPFVGQLHSTTLCCGEEINSSPFFRAAVAADVEALALMLAHGADVEWTPAK